MGMPFTAKAEMKTMQTDGQIPTAELDPGPHSSVTKEDRKVMT